MAMKVALIGVGAVGAATAMATALRARAGDNPCRPRSRAGEGRSRRHALRRAVVAAGFDCARDYDHLGGAQLAIIVERRKRAARLTAMTRPATTARTQ